MLIMNNYIIHIYECIDIYIQSYNDLILLYINKNNIYNEIKNLENNLNNYYNKSNYYNKTNFLQTILNNVIYIKNKEINKINSYMKKYINILNDIYSRLS